MKNNVFYFFVFAFLFIGSSSIQAQFGPLNKRLNEVGGLIKNKQNKNQKQDSVLSQQNELQQQTQTENTQQDNASQQRQGQFNSAFMNAIIPGKEIPIEKQYSFASNMIMDMVSFDNQQQKEQKMVYTVYYSPDSKNFAADFESKNDQNQTIKTTMIGDYKNLAFLMLSDDGSQKTGLVTPIDSAGQANNQNTQLSAQDQKNWNEAIKNLYKKTGNSKTINSFACDEYVVEDSIGICHIWLSKSLDSDLWNAYSKISNQPTYNFLAPFGFMVEMEWHDKNSKSYNKYTLRQINLNSAKTIDVSSYQLLFFGNTQ